MNPLRVLLTGSGAPGWVPIYKCLMAADKTIEVFGCDINPQTAGAYYAKKHFTVPNGSNPEYINVMLSIANEHNIDVILPITDAELLPLARNAQKFTSKNIQIPISSPESLEIATNKLMLFAWMAENNIPTCQYIVARSWKEFCDASKQLGYPQKAICFKPTRAWGSRGFRIIDPSVDMYDILMNEKPTSTYISFEQIEKILSRRKDFPEMLVMEYLPGKEYTVDIFMQSGKTQYILPRLRTQMKSGITTEGIVEENKDVIELSKKISEQLNLSYAVGIQFKYNQNGKPIVLEINPRLQGTTVISFGAGINIPYFTILAATGEQIPILKPNYGVHMFRHWNEVFFKNNRKLSVFKD